MAKYFDFSKYCVCKELGLPGPERKKSNPGRMTPGWTYETSFEILSHHSIFSLDLLVEEGSPRTAGFHCVNDCFGYGSKFIPATTGKCQREFPRRGVVGNRVNPTRPSVSERVNFPNHVCFFLLGKYLDYDGEHL